MAEYDLGEILFKIKTAGEAEAIAALKELDGAFDRNISRIQRSINVSQRLDQQRQKNIKANNDYFNSVLDVDRAHKSAEASAKAIERELNKLERQQTIAANKAKREADVQAQALAKVESQYIQLKSSIDPVFKAQNDLAEATRRLDAAVKAELITVEQAAASLEEYRRVQVAAGVSFDEFGRVLDVTTRKARRFASSGMQQVGYQLGDFAVQVQSGTNVAVAFGQQMSQLLGILGPYGALAGAAVAIGTAFVAPFFRAKKEAEEYTKKLQGIGDTLNQLNEIRMDKVGESLSDAAETAKAAFQNLLDIMEEVAMKELKISLKSPFDAIVQDLKDFQRQSNLAAQMQLKPPDFSKSNQFGFQTEDQAYYALGRIQEFMQGETKEDLQTGLVLLEEQLRFRGLLTDEMKKYLSIMADELGIVDTIQQKNEIREKSAQEAFEQRQQWNEWSMRSNDEYWKAQREAEEQARRDAEEAAGAIQAAFETMNERRKYMSRAYGNEEIAASQAAVAAQAQAEQKFLDQLIEAKKQGKDLSQLDLKLPFESALSAALAIAQALGMSNIEAFNLASKMSQITTGPIMGGRGRTVPDATDSAIAGLGGMFIPTEPKKRGGKSEAQKAEEYLQNLERELEFKGSIIGKSEEERSRLEDVYKIQRAIGDKQYKIHEERIEQLLKEEEELRRRQETQAFYDSIQDSVTNNLTNAFMAMIDGSKSVEEAFKAAIRNIVADIAATMIKTAITKFLFSADGNAFSGGSKINAFADGGVISGPTYFPMTSGVGLMGEAGPEAIMPLKRGANGKLGVEVQGGAGENIVINQTINVSTGVQQTVRNEIRSMMPEIAAQSKNAVLDAKRRGGAYAARF